MEIAKAKKVVELTKDNRRILLTVWDGNNISSCVEEERKQHCETCQGDEALCRDYVEHLKSQGYEATEIELREPEAAESLPRFMQEREDAVKATPDLADERVETADIQTSEAPPGDSGEE